MPIACNYREVRNNLDQSFEDACSKFDGQFLSGDTVYTLKKSSDTAKLEEEVRKEMKKIFKRDALTDGWTEVKGREVHFSIPEYVEPIIKYTLIKRKRILFPSKSEAEKKLDELRKEESKAAVVNDPNDLEATLDLFEPDVSSPLAVGRYAQNLQDILEHAEERLNFLRQESRLNVRDQQLKAEVETLQDFVTRLKYKVLNEKELGTASSFVASMIETLAALNDLVENESVKNTNTIHNIILQLEDMFNGDVSNIDDGNYVFKTPLKLLKEEHPVLYDLVKNNLRPTLNKIKDQHEENIDNLFTSVVEVYLRREMQFSNEKVLEEDWDDFVRSEIKRINDLHRKDISVLEKYLKVFGEVGERLGMTLKESEKANSIPKIINSFYAYNQKAAQQKATRQKLADIKEDLEKELKRNGHDFSIFYRDKETHSKLVSRFNTDYDDLKTSMRVSSYKIANLLRKPKTPQETTELTKSVLDFNKSYNKNFNFVPFHLIPEMAEIEGVEIDITEAEEFKQDYIDKYNETEWKTFVKESYESYGYWLTHKSKLINRQLKDKKLETLEELKEYYPRSYENMLDAIDKSSPVYLSNKYKEDENFFEENRDINLIFSARVLKDNKSEEYIDENFDLIESNEIYNEGYKTFLEAFEYIHYNHFRNSRSSQFDIPYIRDHAKELFNSNNANIKAFSKDVLRKLGKAMSTTPYQNSKEVNVIQKAKAVKTIEDEIASRTVVAVDRYTKINLKEKIKTQQELKEKGEKSVGVNEINKELLMSLLKVDEVEVENAINRALENAEKTEEGLKLENGEYVIPIKPVIKEIMKKKVKQSQTKNLFDVAESGLDIAERVETIIRSEEEAVFLYNKLELISKNNRPRNKTDRETLKETLGFTQDFINAKILGVNNRNNFSIRGKEYFPIKINISPEEEDGLKKASKDVLKEYKDVLKNLKKQLKETEDDNEKRFLLKDIEDTKEILLQLENFAMRGTRHITPGSLIDLLFIKLSYFKVFFANIKAALANKTFGAMNAYEVDGILWKQGNYQKAKNRYSYLRRQYHKGFRTSEGDNMLIVNLMMNRLALFQASTSHVYKVEKGINTEMKNELFGSLDGPAKLNSIAERAIQTPQILAILADTNEDGTPKFGLKGKDSNGNEITVPVVDLVGDDMFPAFEYSNGKLKLKDNFETKENYDTWIANTTEEWNILSSDKGPIGNKIGFINGRYADSDYYLYDKYLASFLVMMFKRFFLNHITKKTKMYSTAAKSGNAADAALLESLSSLTLALNLPMSAGFNNPIQAVLGLTSLGFPLAMVFTSSVAAFIDSKSRKEMFSKNVLKSVGTSMALPIYKTAQIATNKFAGIFLRNNYVLTDEMANKMLNLEDSHSTRALHFISVSIAYRILFTIMRMAVLSFGKPDDDEEEEWRDNLDNRSFFQKLYRQPKMFTYIVADNFIQNIINDANALSSGDMTTQMFEPASFNQLEKFYKGLRHPFDNYQSGIHADRNKFAVGIAGFAFPYALDGNKSTSIGPFSFNPNFGFVGLAQRRYNTRSLVAYMFKKPKDKVEFLKKEYDKEVKEVLGLEDQELKRAKKSLDLSITISGDKDYTKDDVWNEFKKELETKEEKLEELRKAKNKEKRIEDAKVKVVRRKKSKKKKGSKTSGKVIGYNLDGTKIYE